MRISGLEQVVIGVKAPARALTFYRDQLGLPCEAVDDAVRVGLGGGMWLLLVPAPEAPSHRFALSLQVEDPDVFARELGERGVEIVAAPHDTPAHTRRCTVRDPDGVELHLERPLERPRA